MNEFTQKAIRIGEAAAAIGVSPKALRQWLDRYADKGVTPHNPQSGTWTQFSMSDVIVFAQVKHMVEFGIPAFAAFEIARNFYQETWPEIFDPRATLKDALSGLGREHIHSLLFIEKDDGTGTWKASRVRSEECVDTIMKASAMLILQPGKISLNVVRRLGKANNRSADIKAVA